MSVALFLQQDKLSVLLKDTRFWGEGFFPRVMPVFPFSNAGWRAPLGQSADPRVWESFSQRARYLYEYPWRRGANGAIEPHVLELTPEAYSEWHGLSQWFESQMQPSSSIARMKSWLGKAPTTVARIAALYHLFETSEEHVKSKISACHVRCAGDLVQKLIPHVQIIYNAIHPDPTEEVLRKIKHWLFSFYGTNDYFTLRDLYRSSKIKAEFVLPAIDWLLQNEVICEAFEPDYGREAGRIGRPKSRGFCINFNVLKSLPS